MGSRGTRVRRLGLWRGGPVGSWEDLGLTPQPPRPPGTPVAQRPSTPGPCAGDPQAGGPRHAGR